MTIRAEAPADADEISKTIRQAFENHPHSRGAEAAIVRGLRGAGVLTVSLVAVVDDRIVGHVAASPVTIMPEARSWFGLGPVSVDPAHQSKGIGRALIDAAMDSLHARGAQGCVVLGDPAYYRRFDFEVNQSLTLDGVPPEYFMVRSFGAPPPAGTVAYHAAFDAKP